MRKSGFTLSELLIALAILGVIATFTIPKVLQSQQSSQYKAAAKEAAATISGAYEAYKQANGLSGSMVKGALTPFINYVAVYTTASVSMDHVQGQGSVNCTAVHQCLRLHNGGMFRFPDTLTENFGGTANTNVLLFHFDPDGKVTNGGDTSPTAAGKAVPFFLHYNGRITTQCCIASGSASSDNVYNPGPANDPPWFGWN